MERSEKTEWIQQKYVDRAFMAPMERAEAEAALVAAAEKVRVSNAAIVTALCHLWCSE